MLRLNKIILILTFLFGIGVLLFGFTIFFIDLNNADDISPNIMIYNAGSVRANSSIRHKFIINNPLSDEVPIIKVIKSCSCLDVEGLPESIPPKANIEVAIVASTFSQDGWTISEVLIITENLGNIVLRLMMNVVNIYPFEIELPTVKRGRKMIKTFYVKNIDHTVPNIAIKNKYRIFDIHTEERADIGGIQVDVLIPENIKYGPFRDTIEYIDRDTHEVLGHTIVMGYVLRQVETETNKIGLGHVKAGEWVKTKIAFYSPYDMPIEKIYIDDSNNKIPICNIKEKYISPERMNIDLSIMIPEKLEELDIFSGEINFIAISDGQETRIPILFQSVIVTDP